MTKPEQEHFIEIDPQLDGSFKIRETLGLRSIEWVTGNRDAGAIHRDSVVLNNVTTLVLAHFGHEAVLDVAAKIEAARPNDPAAKTEAILAWLAAIVAKHGRISPAGSAAMIQALQYRLLELATQPATTSEQMSARSALVLELCEEWHWFRLNAEGEHERILKEHLSESNLENGRQAAKIKKRDSDGVVLNCCERHWQRNATDRRSPERTAVAMMHEINANLSVAGFKPYNSAQSLERRIRKIQRGATARA